VSAMSSSATRGAVLVAIAAVLVFLVLRGAADNSQYPLVSGSEAEPTATTAPELELSSDDAVAVGAGTVEVDTSLARDNSEVSVLVANGTAVTGQASRLTTQLRNQGFMTREPRNADEQTASTIFYRPGFASEAAVVRVVLDVATPIAPMPEPDPFIGDGIDLAPVNVLVLVGADDLAQS
jgi:hypothetical protein